MANENIDVNSLTARLDRLEAESEIRKLKARYLNACDAKDPEAIRACFSKDAMVEYPPIGEFNVDGLIKIFTEMAVESNIVDVHQAHNPEIEITGDRASAKWNLSYTMYDPDSKNFRLLASFYYDEYIKTEHGWLIRRSRSAPRSIVDGKLDQGAIEANWVPSEL